MSAARIFWLALEDVSVSFDGFLAVMAELYIDRGELRVIIGPNGAGKDHRARSDLRAHEVSGGSIKVQGPGDHRPQGTGDRSPRYRAKISNSDDLRRPHGIRKSRAFLAARSQCNWSAVLKRDDEVEQRVREIGAMIFLEDHLDRPAETLSHGQKQWLEIGMLLIQDPELLMLDEPVAGMSVSERAKTAELLNEIHQESLGGRDRARHENSSKASRTA